MPEENIIKRAFDLAGECGTVEDVRRKLTQEGYSQVSAHLSGRTINADLKRRLNPEIRTAQAKERALR